MHFDIEFSLHLGNDSLDSLLELLELPCNRLYNLTVLGSHAVDLVLESLRDGEGLLNRERLVDERLVEPSLPLDPLPVAQVYLHRHVLQVLGHPRLKGFHHLLQLLGFL